MNVFKSRFSGPEQMESFTNELVKLFFRAKEHLSRKYFSLYSVSSFEDDKMFFVGFFILSLIYSRFFSDPKLGYHRLR